jgi:hypothetical protein
VCAPLRVGPSGPSCAAGAPAILREYGALYNVVVAFLRGARFPSSFNDEIAP